jgi:hypothetical protein
MNPPPSNDWFTSVVVSRSLNLGPYQAQVSPRGVGVYDVRFTGDVIEQIARDINRLADPSHPTLHLEQDIAEIHPPPAHTPAETPVSRVEPDTDGRYQLGRELWEWTEHADCGHSRLDALLRDVARTRYKPVGPQEWTVAFADHGWRMVPLAILPTPAEESVHFELWHTLYQSALGSYEVTAPTEFDAELAARRFFATDRADADPHATTQTLAMPGTRIPGPSREGGSNASQPRR